MRIVLASRSPRRRDLLSRIGIDPDIQPADVDEAPLHGEAAADTARRLASAKAHAVAAPGDVVVAADTIVELDGRQLGKPADDADARDMLLRLSGRVHEVVTGVCVVTDDRTITDVATTKVRFRPLSPTEVDWYVATGEGRDKAGGYAIQGGAGAFVDEIVGSPSNVIGLPLSLVVQLLESSGVQIFHADVAAGRRVARGGGGSS